MILRSLAAVALLGLSTGAADPAPLERVKALYQTFNRHDAQSLPAFYAPDARITSSDFCGPRGRGDIERTYAALFRAMPDIRDDIRSIVADGDTVAIRFTAVATMNGAPVRIELASFLKFRGGLIVEDDTVFDTGGRPCEP